MTSKEPSYKTTYIYLLSSQCLFADQIRASGSDVTTDPSALGTGCFGLHTK